MKLFLYGDPMEIDPIKKRFAHFVRDWYKNTWEVTGKSRLDCAKFLGISYSQFSNILNSYRISSESERIRICKRIGVDYFEIVTDEELKPEAKKSLKSPPVDPVHHPTASGRPEITVPGKGHKTTINF